ncbi:MAG: UDP-N-acetylmuramoyl-tripeptide--D-alanyl-D-alanine ligase [Streptococcaceae bacterium]|nr:UDP-N-acetylmuramoyl-tripeptide--D-alanyl-D-alanine ligase [Streptococcaceae bacterium]
MRLSLAEIAKATSGTLSDEKLSDLTVTALEFDSRKLTFGAIFLPLKGETSDGHDFIAQAFENGAVATFTEHSVDFPHILVKDCQKAFEDLTQAILKKQQPKIVAITGSNGKTTTKDMTAAVLSEKYTTYKTQGNYNSLQGLCYTVCAMPEATDMLVLEMGMDRPGDIDTLSNLTRPDFGVVTLIGESHLEFFGTREAIAKGKMGMTAGLKGPLLAPADKIIDPYIPENQEIVRFGDGADIHLSELTEARDHMTFKVNFLDETLTIPVPGKFNATNAMLAAYVGQHFKASPEQIKHALSHVTLTKNRTEWLKAANGADILNDAYNANPTSMRLILETFQNLPANPNGRKIAVLADMLELGPTSPDLHAGISEAVKSDKLQEIYLYGPLMKHLADKLPEAHYFTDLSELTEAVKAHLQPSDQILFKGSNGMHLSELIEVLTH